MAGFQFRVEVKGEEQIARAFSRFGESVSDLSEAFREIADDFHKIEANQFESEGGYGSGGWKPLSVAYAKRKPLGRPLLVLSGLMKESLVGETPYSIEKIQPLEARLGTKVPYAIYHQTGTTKMPKRPLIQLTEGDKSRWLKIIQRYLVKAAKEAGWL